ncbi:MAG: hypothetical protein ABI358_14755 [Ginsengibacter sp.]
MKAEITETSAGIIETVIITIASIKMTIATIIDNSCTNKTEYNRQYLGVCYIPLILIYVRGSGIKELNQKIIILL